MWESIKSALLGIAPALANAIGFGGFLGEKALTIAADVLNSDASSPESLLSAISKATPEQQLALKKASQEFYQDYNDKMLQAFQVVADIQKTVHADQSQTTTALRREAFWVTSFMLFSYEALLFWLCRNGSLDSTEAATLGNIGGVIVAKYSTIIDFLFGTGIDSIKDIFKSKFD